MRNGDTAASKGFTFDLTALPAVGADGRRPRTSRTENLVSLTAVPIQNWSFVATVTPGSITTFVVTIALREARSLVAPRRRRGVRLLFFR